jgi:hypothetical protein
VPSATGDETIRVEPVPAARRDAIPPASPPAPAARAAAPARDDCALPPAQAAGTAPPVRDDRAVPPATVTDGFTVSPWPFDAERVVVGCEARELRGSFADATALDAALASAPWVALRFALSPG